MQRRGPSNLTARGSVDNAWATVQVHAYLDARRVPRRGAEGPRIVVKMKSRVDLEIQKKFQAKKSFPPTQNHNVVSRRIPEWRSCTPTPKRLSGPCKSATVGFLKPLSWIAWLMGPGTVPITTIVTILIHEGVRRLLTWIYLFARSSTAHFAR